MIHFQFKLMTLKLRLFSAINIINVHYSVLACISFGVALVTVTAIGTVASFQTQVNLVGWLLFQNRQLNKRSEVLGQELVLFEGVGVGHLRADFLQVHENSIRQDNVYGTCTDLIASNA